MNHPNDPLDALIAAERAVTPPAGARDAAWTALQARLELAAVPATATKLALVKPLAAAVGLGIVVAAGAIILPVRDPAPARPHVYADHTPHSSPVPTDSPLPAVPADGAAASGPPVPTHRPDARRAASVPPDSPTSSVRPASPAHADTWTDELAALQAIHAALRDDRPADALALVDAHVRRWPRGEFREEVEAARVLGLCARDHGSAAQHALAAFARRWPSSLYTARLRRRCARDGNSGAADTTPRGP